MISEAEKQERRESMASVTSVLTVLRAWCTARGNTAHHASLR